jgi:hypothetical protein
LLWRNIFVTLFPPTFSIDWAKDGGMGKVLMLMPLILTFGMAHNLGPGRNPWKLTEPSEVSNLNHRI